MYGLGHTWIGDKKMANGIYEAIKAAGVETDHHEADLYAPVNEITEKLVAEYEFKRNVTRFRCAIDGKMWFDIPFAYTPFWEAAARR